MQHKLTITIDEEIYRGLRQQVGRGHISSFIEDLVRPHILTQQDLDDGYRAMAADTEREAEAKEWIEGLIADGLE
ncbi:MAG TPA: addiction module antitoxin [Chloroflexota bacterium]|jgi:predicted CopG family antitoxin